MKRIFVWKTCIVAGAFISRGASAADATPAAAPTATPPAVTPSPSGAPPGPSGPPPGSPAPMSTSFSGPAAPAQASSDDRLPVVRLSVVRPEWSYRSFRNREPSTTDKTYNASGIAGFGGWAEFYPFNIGKPGLPFWRDLGVTASFGRALDLVSIDLERDVRDDQVAPTIWYHFSYGLRFRALGRGNPLSLAASADVEWWVFDFEHPTPARREVATARYVLLPIGADIRYDLRPFAVFGGARFMLPLSIGPLGDRTPSGGNFGVRASAGFAFVLSRIFEIDLRADYSLFTFTLPVVANRPDQRGSVYDQYLTLSAGLTLSF